MEDALIARFVSQLGARHPAVELGIGDDSAVLAGGWCVERGPADRGRPLPDAHDERARSRLEGDRGEPLGPRGDGGRAGLRARRARSSPGSLARRAGRAVRGARRVRVRLRRAGRRRRHEPRTCPDALGDGHRPSRPTGAPQRRRPGRRRVRDRGARRLARRSRPARGTRRRASPSALPSSSATCDRCHGLRPGARSHRSPTP